MFIIFILLALVSVIVSFRFRSKIKTYSQQSLRNNMSGAEIAERMLSDHDIHDVRVISAEGELTDHYNPVKKTVNLSHDVYHGRNVSAAAIAAHECGHAVQHAQAYSMLTLRSTLVPVQNASAKIMNIIVIAMFLGLFAVKAFPVTVVILTVIACQAMITLFSLITLPVEFDASKRALAWLTTKGYVVSDESVMAKDALKWAAMTYVVAALAAVASLLYWVMMMRGRD